MPDHDDNIAPAADLEPVGQDGGIPPSSALDLEPEPVETELHTEQLVAIAAQPVPTPAPVAAAPEPAPVAVAAAPARDLDAERAAIVAKIDARLDRELGPLEAMLAKSATLTDQLIAANRAQVAKLEALVLQQREENKTDREALQRRIDREERALRPHHRNLGRTPAKYGPN